MKLSWQSHSYKLHTPVKLSYGLVKSRKVIVLKLTEGGISGLGELVFVPYYHLSEEDIFAQLKVVTAFVEDKQFNTPNEFYEEVQLLIPGSQFLLSALDCAFWDLKAKRAHLALGSFIGLKPKLPILSCITVSDNGDSQFEKYLDWPLIKIKMGYPGDLEFLNKILSKSRSELIIDANRGWSVDEAVSTLSQVDQSRILYLEEPLSASSEASYNQLREALDISLLADESFQTIDDLTHASRKFDAINIKIMKCGGITPALEIIKQARKARLKIVGGCMMGSTISVLPIVHLYPLLDHLDADGAFYLADEPWHGLSIHNGQVEIKLPHGIGI